MNRARLVILVEDDPDDVMLIERAIAVGHPTAFELRILRDGMALMTHINDHPDIKPDLLILDLNLPRMNGQEVLAECQQRQLLTEVPIVVFTTSENPDDRRRSLELGATAFVTKPDTFTAMASALSQLLEKYLG